MPLRKFQRNETWYLRGTVRDQRVYETTGTADEAAAEAIRIKRESELLEQSIFGRKAVATFEQAVDSYLDHGGSIKFLGSFDPATKRWSGIIGHFYGRKLHTIRQEDLDKAAGILMPQGKGQSRNRNVYTPFIAVWNHAARLDWCEKKSWVRPRDQAVHNRRYATLDEIERLEAAARPHIKPLLVFLVYTGARPSEAFRLDWKDVDLEHRWCVLRETKRNDESRGVGLHPRTIEALTSIPLPKGETARKGKVFLTNKRKPYVDRKSEYGGHIKSAWATMCTEADIKGLTPYSLRHTFATWLEAVGVEKHIQKLLMGHASGEMNARYAHIPQASLIEAVDKLPSGAKDVQRLGDAWKKSLVQNG